MYEQGSMRRQSVAISGNQWQSVAISDEMYEQGSMRRQSVAISGSQMQSVTSGFIAP